jgi:hypothetical protein
MDTDLSRKCIGLENNVRKLFIVLNNIKNKVSSVKIVNSNNVIYASLDKFINLYNDIGAEDSMVIFEELYKRKRIQILSKKDIWIREKAFLEYPTTKKVKTKGMIFLSIFYTNALDIAKEAEKDVVEFGREDEAANVYLPEELIYPLLEIFLLVAPQEDVELLESYKQEIVSELPSTDITPTVHPIMANLGGLLGNVLNGLDLSSIQKNLQASQATSGESSEGSPQPPDLMEAMGKLLNNPKSKEIMSNVTSKFNNVKGIDGLQQAIGGLLTDKQLVEDVKSITSELIPKPPEPISDREVTEMIAEAAKLETPPYDG